MTVRQNHRFHVRSVYHGLKELCCARFGTAPPRAFREADPPLVTLQGSIPATLVFCLLWHPRVARQRFSRSSLATPSMPETSSPACSPQPAGQHAWLVRSCSTACQAACSHAQKTQLLPFFFLFFLLGFFLIFRVLKIGKRLALRHDPVQVRGSGELDILYRSWSKKKKN